MQEPFVSNAVKCRQECSNKTNALALLNENQCLRAIYMTAITHNLKIIMNYNIRHRKSK